MNNYSRGSWLRHFLHKQDSLDGREDVSRFSREKHQQVFLPALMSHWAGSPQEGQVWLVVLP